MANQSKLRLITSTERDEAFEKARLDKITAIAHANYLSFRKEMIEMTGEATGLGSSRWAVGEQKNYQIAPGGPRNLDLDENSLCRHKPPSKMNTSPNNGDWTSKLGKLGGLQNSRFSPKIYGNATYQFNSRSSSGQSILKANATVFTPTKAKSRSSSICGSAQLFTPKSQASPSNGGGVSMISSPTAVVKDVAAKKPNYQKAFEQMLLADYQKRMDKFQTVTPTKTDSADEAIVVAVSSPAVIMENKVGPVISAASNAVGSGNIAIAIQERSVVSKASSIIEEKSIDMAVITKVGSTAPSETSSSSTSSQAISAAPSIMKENEFMAMLVKAQAEKIAKRSSISASSTRAASVAPVAEPSIAEPSIAEPSIVEPSIAAPSVTSIAVASISASSIPAAIPALSLPRSRDAIDADTELQLPTAPSQPVIAGPSLMKENEFMAMLIKREQEKALKRKSILASAPAIKNQDLKVNIQLAGSDFSYPPSQNPTNKVISKTNNIVKHKQEAPIMDKSISATQTKTPFPTMSNKPLIPAPINKWTTAKLTQGKALSKADEDFQTFLTNKTAAAAAANAARTQEQIVTKPLSPKKSIAKPTQAEVNAEKLKLAAGQADFNALLTRRFANTPTSPPPKQPMDKTSSQGFKLNSNVAVFTMPEVAMKDGQAILSELKAASKDFVTNAPIIKKENDISTNPFNEKVTNALNTVYKKPADPAGNIAAFKGESSQDKISHVAVHGFTPNEKENAIHTDTKVDNPFNDTLLDKKNQAGSLVSSPPFWSISSSIDIGDKMDNTFVDPNFKEAVRVTETQDANQILCDWNGSWCAPPIWEERGSFDSDYIPSYIREWSAAVSPVRPVTITVDTSAEGFISGEELVNNVILSKAPKHEPTIPDTSDPSVEDKRVNQTSGKEAAAYLKKYEKVQEAREYTIITNNAYDQELLAREPAPHPYAPKIEIYLRPANVADAKQILQIYNHYITESYIPEDQEPLTESDILYLLDATKKDKTPFVVAVKGRVPAQSTNPKIKTKVPQYENIISFGYTEMRGCGIAGKANGRSRYTHNLHFFVHHDYTRKGVGSCVLDRLLQVSSRGWTAHDGYDWLNTDKDFAYENGCGARCHQMLIEVPVLAKNDPTYEWKKEFLRKFWFREEFRLKSIGRTSIAQGEGKWLDVVHFQKELEHEAEFTPFV